MTDPLPRPLRDDLRPWQPLGRRCRRIPSSRPASAPADAGVRRRKRLPRIRPAGHPRRPGGAARRAAPAASSACRACCSPPATSRTTCRRKSTPSPPKIPASRSPSAASSRSTPAAAGRRPPASPPPRPPPQRPVDRKQTLLMVVGRGTNDPDANSNVSKVARMLWEGMGFGWTEVCYSGVAYPLVDVGLGTPSGSATAGSSSFRTSCSPASSSSASTAMPTNARRRIPKIEIVKARLPQRPSAGHRHLRRAGRGDAAGTNLMNCLLCKYREQIHRLRGRPGRAAGRPPLIMCAASAPTAITAMITGTGMTRSRAWSRSSHAHGHGASRSWPCRAIDRMVTITAAPVPSGKNGG